MPAKSNPLWKPTSGRRELCRWLGALGLISLVAVSAAHGQNAAPPEAVSEDEAPAPEAPSAVLDLVEVHPFRVRTEYRHDWSAGRPLVSSGLLVVLKVDPAYVLPRNTAEPVLYAGDLTVQRLNHGHRSGYVVGLIPGEPDLAKSLLFFGRPGQPGRVTPEGIAAEKALAESLGFKPFSREQIERVSGDAVEAEDLAALLRGQAADLVLKYSPDEKSLAETWRLPTVGPAVPR